MSEFPEKIWLADDGDELTRHAPVYDFWYSGEPDFTDVKSEYIRSDLVTQWQPIETLTEEDRVVILMSAHDVKLGFIEGYHVKSNLGRQSREDFTHWMPIPKAPG
jgi:hypothetical protein